MNRPGNAQQNIRQLLQDPQSAARAMAAAGESVAGYVGNNVPVALILAAGAMPVRLRGNPKVTPSNAERFFESSIAPELRIIANQWLQGALDHLDAVVFSRADDSGQRLYYYLCELQRRGLCAGPQPLLFDVASLPRDASFEHTLESVRLLASQLGAATEALPQAIERVGQREELLRSVQAQRQLPAPLAGSAAWAFEYAAACDWRPAFDEAARDWMDGAALLPMPKRILLTGDPPPDEQLHTAIEAAGASVVLELTESMPGGERTRRDPLAAIAEEYRRRESPAVSMRHNARWLADRALDLRADAVLVWLSEQNEALPWEIARQMRSLCSAGLPAMLLVRQPWHISAAVLTQVMHFARTPGEFL